MKLWTLTENTTCREDLETEHGLSLYLETGERKILFDAGQTGLFRKNAEKLGVDLTAVDTVVLSHGHYDHGGGLLAFLDINKKAPIYASDLCFGKFYNGPVKYIGLNPMLETCNQLVTVPDKLSLGDGMTLYPGRLVSTPRKIQSGGLVVRNQRMFIPDTFLHEQYLLLEENGKRILFTGCSHRGIVNIASHFRPDVLIGGFHFKNVDPQKEPEILRENAQALLELPTMYYTCHCTGTAQYDFLKSIMGDRISYLSAGTELNI